MAKVLEGGVHPDRDAQFQRITERKAEYFNAGNPVFSVDTKAKERLGQLYRKGRVRTQQGQLARLRREAVAAVRTLPFVFADSLGSEELRAFSTRLAEAH